MTEATLHARHQYLTNPQDGTLGKIWSYACDHDLNECLKDGYFNTLIGNLLPGDTIRLVQKDTLGDIRKCVVLATASVMVVAISHPHVRVEPNGEKYDFRAPAPAASEKPQDLGERYAEATGEVKWNPGSKTHDVVVNGEVVAKLPKDQKDLALRIAHGDAPLPEPVAA